jgi:hypothetical protein
MKRPMIWVAAMVPTAAFAMPVTYDFTGELNNMIVYTDGTTNGKFIHDSLPTRTIHGTVEYDTDTVPPLVTVPYSGVGDDAAEALNFDPSISFLRLTIAGSGFAMNTDLPAGAVTDTFSEGLTAVDFAPGAQDVAIFGEGAEYVIGDIRYGRSQDLYVNGPNLISPGHGAPQILPIADFFHDGSGSFGNYHLLPGDQFWRGYGGSFDVTSFTRAASSVPEPGSLVLFAAGLLSLAASGRKKAARL